MTELKYDGKQDFFGFDQSQIKVNPHYYVLFF